MIESGQAEFVTMDHVIDDHLCLEPSPGYTLVDPEQARRTRRVFLERHADTGVLVMPAHFPTPTAGWVRTDGSAFRFHFHL